MTSNSAPNIVRNNSGVDSSMSSSSATTGSSNTIVGNRAYRLGNTGSNNVGVGVNVLEDEEVREGIKAYSSRPTIPQLYVKGEFVGGCDIVREMYESGELIEFFNTNGINIQLANPE